MGLSDYNFPMLRKSLIALGLAVLAGCASRAPTDPEKVRIFESVTGAPQIGEVIERLWIEEKTTAFWFPYYDSVEEATGDFKRLAARRGGDGVINFGCYPLKGNRADSPLACNGTVVRFK